MKNRFYEIYLNDVWKIQYPTDIKDKVGPNIWDAVYYDTEGDIEGILLNMPRFL